MLSFHVLILLAIILPIILFIIISYLTKGNVESRRQAQTVLILAVLAYSINLAVFTLMQ